MLRAAVPLVILFLFLPAIATAQSSNSLSNTTCTFQSGKEMSVRFDPVPIKKGQKLPDGEEWAPGGQPMYIFTQTPLKLGDVTIPVGAYSLYIVPAEKKGKWSLVVNKGVTEGAKYDKSQDLVRAPMVTGELPDRSGQFSAYLGRMGPHTCSLNLDIGRTRAFADIKEQQ